MRLAALFVAAALSVPAFALAQEQTVEIKGTNLGSSTIRTSTRSSRCW